MAIYDVVAIDDEAAVRELYRDIFKHACLKFYITHIPEAVIQKIKKNEIRVLITDINMGLMNGNILAEKVREIDPLLPIIAVSGSAIESLPQPNIFSCILKKPFSIEQLLRLILEVLQDES